MVLVLQIAIWHFCSTGQSKQTKESQKSSQGRNPKKQQLARTSSLRNWDHNMKLSGKFHGNCTRCEISISSSTCKKFCGSVYSVLTDHVYLHSCEKYTDRLLSLQSAKVILGIPPLRCFSMLQATNYAYKGPAKGVVSWKLLHEAA